MGSTIANRHNQSGSDFPSPEQSGLLESEAEEMERGEPVSGLLAFKALGIATAVVCGSAGLGAFVVAKLLGVNDVRSTLL
jgi:hypothetical protein